MNDKKCRKPYKKLIRLSEKELKIVLQEYGYNLEDYSFVAVQRGYIKEVVFTFRLEGEV